MFSLLRSIVAGIAGIFVGAILAIAVDYALERVGIIPSNNLFIATWLIWAILAYRTVFTILGCYVTAKLAPHHPMHHAVVVGLLGAAVAAFGAYATRNMNLGPSWYAWTLAVLTVPTGFVGGWLAKR